MKQYLHASVRKCWAITLVLLSANLPSFSQYGEKTSYWEAGISIGPSNFLGDLGGSQGRGQTFLKDNNFTMTKFAFGLYAGYHPNEYFGFRLGVNFGSLEGDDAVIKGKGGLEEARKIRNSNFKSKLTEAMIALEVFPTAFIEYEPSDVFLKLRPYGVIGVGVFKFNPMGTNPDNGQWVALQPLRTEGQGMANHPDRKEYKLTQLNIPMGVGLKYFLSERVNVSLEILHRKTFTDYIDDVSTNYIDPADFDAYFGANTPQAAMAAKMANKTGINTTAKFGAGEKRGTPTNNDAYYSVDFRLGFRLGSGDRYSNSTRCPVRF